MIAATALDLFVMALALWQLVVVRRSLRADREKAEAERTAAGAVDRCGRAERF